jgi:NAD(P)-dependent dehydrogenase (short-subunit alcohol dehydrogenase family)
MTDLRFDGRVAVVTGAGSGIGRAHALTLARRGALVVVNDRGTTLDGETLSSGPAQSVVDEITALGGSAIACTDSVSSEQGAAAIVGIAMETYGRLDVVINNAGIFHYADLAHLSLARFQAMLDVHVLGPFLVTRAAWPHFVRQKYGRVLLTCSSVGLFGLSHGSHYSSAKAAVIGLTRSLAAEGMADGIQVNAVAPGASTRSSTDVLSGEFLEWFSAHFRPDSVAAVAAWLVHEDCADSGQIYAAQAGRVARILIAEAGGYFNPDISPEDVRDHHQLVEGQSGPVVMASMEQELEVTIDCLTRAGVPSPPPMGDFDLTES